MKKASITEAKNNLSALIDRVKSGSPVLIVDRGRPVARLESVTGDQGGDEAGRLDHLVRAGVVRAGRGPFPKARWRRRLRRTKRPPSGLCRSGKSVDEVWDASRFVPLEKADAPSG